jgi:signal transduction histidine kinase
MEFIFQYEEAYVMADSSLIQTVLVNLLDNACKASEQGSRIETEGRLEQDGYRFTVRDYGIGIPDEEVSKITQAFYMVDKSRSRSRNGAGLGLSLCTEILALHGSSLEIKSRLGEGTEVGFLLQEGKEEQYEAIHS